MGDPIPAAEVADVRGNEEVEVWIPAPSPLLHYSPSRNGKPGEGWYMTPRGALASQGHGEWGVEYTGHFSSWTWYFAAPSSYTVSIGLDGSKSSNSGASGSATLRATPGNHSVSLSASCETCTGNDAFRLMGARLTTPLRGASSGGMRNATLDDSSAEVTYSGWSSDTSSAHKGEPEGIRGGRYYRDTISYTSTRGASAKLSFEGVAIYIFGPTGPDFGEFEVRVDNRSSGLFSSANSLSTSTLLFFGAGFGEGRHEVEIVNREEGKLLALDYFVATSSAPDIGDAVPPGPPGSSPLGGPFTGGHGGGDSRNGSAGAVIGGILGALLALAILFLLWRYWKWKKAGGEGSVFQACFGPRRRPTQAAGTSKDDFRVWPMIRSRPKYAT